MAWNCQGCGKFHAGASLDPWVQFVVRSCGRCRQFGGLRRLPRPWTGRGVSAPPRRPDCATAPQPHGNPGDFGRQFAAGDIIAPAEQRRHHVFFICRRFPADHNAPCRSALRRRTRRYACPAAVGLVEEKSAYSMISSRICLTRRAYGRKFIDAVVEVGWNIARAASRSSLIATFSRMSTGTSRLPTGRMRRSCKAQNKRTWFHR